MRDDAEISVHEVPLEGDASPAEATTGTKRPAPNWRKLAGVSALAGTVIGIVVATVVLTSGDDDPPATTVDPNDLASAITVPPTLTPATTPTGTLAPSPGDDAPGVDPLTDVSLVAESVDTLPPATGTTPQPDTFRLSDGSLAALDTPAARRSVTDYVIGVGGYEQTVTITNDPDSGRYLIEFRLGPSSQLVIVDLVGGLTYVRTAPDEWNSVPNDQVAAESAVPDMATFVRNLQLGPIRSDTRDAWELVQSNGLVETPGPDDLSESIVVIDAAAVPEWARYLFGPLTEAAPLPSNTKIGYAVYVARDGSIRQLSGSSEFGATTQRVVHTIEELDEPPVIELPSPGATTGAPVRSDPASSDPSTTSPIVSEP